MSVVSGLVTAAVGPLPAAEHSGTFTVTWSGQSDLPSRATTSTPRSTAAAVRLTGTAQVQASYSGIDGHRYGFAVVAVNTLGVRSATPTAPQATTQVQTSAATATMLQASACTPTRTSPSASRRR